MSQEPAAALRAPTEYRPSAALLAFGLAFFLIILVRTAWVSDVAYLTFRTVDHAATGFGLRWNVVERVQVYDHPLWLLVLLLGRFLTGETYFSSLAISMIASMLCLWIVLREARSDGAAVLAIAALTLSPVFVTFSTSGLESPLLHLLGALLVVGALHFRGSASSLVWLASLTALIALTRWTALLFALPVLLPMLSGTTRRTKLTVVAVAIGPLTLWLLWSWWYLRRTLANRMARRPDRSSLVGTPARKRMGLPSRDGAVRSSSRPADQRRTAGRNRGRRDGPVDRPGRTVRRPLDGRHRWRADGRTRFSPCRSCSGPCSSSGG